MCNHRDDLDHLCLLASMTRAPLHRLRIVLKKIYLLFEVFNIFLNILFELPIFVEFIYRILEIHQACTRQTGIGKDHLQPMYLLGYNREPIIKQVHRIIINLSLKNIVITTFEISDLEP